MYVHKHFAMNDPADIEKFIRTHSFGMLISSVQDEPFATHLPFLYDAEQRVLFAHMARANPQWRELDGQKALVVFAGPHAYISPSWYEEPAAVPTWNYVAVHVYGTCSVLAGEDGLKTLLADTVRYYEPDSQLPTRENESFYRNMMKAIVGFRIDITKIEGKAKLSQNRSPAVQDRVVKKLEMSGDPQAQAIGRCMTEWRLHNERVGE
jgi:transcriptional regulator